MTFLQLELDLFRHIAGQSRARVGSAAQGGNAGTRALTEPWTINLMMARRRAEVPHDRLVVLRQKREAHELVHCPGADMRCSNIPNIVHVEAEERAQVRLFQRGLDTIKTIAPQPVDVHALFPIDAHEAESFEAHTTSWS